MSGDIYHSSPGNIYHSSPEGIKGLQVGDTKALKNATAETFSHSSSSSSLHTAAVPKLIKAAATSSGDRECLANAVAAHLEIAAMHAKDGVWSVSDMPAGVPPREGEYYTSEWLKM